MIGPNGIGKSNLLEAVELLGSLRSHRCSQDRDLIQWEAPRALLRAGLDDGDQLELELRRQGGRQARRNGKTLDRQLDLIGPLRCIGFSALDLELVRGEPALRRQGLPPPAARPGAGPPPPAPPPGGGATAAAGPVLPAPTPDRGR